MNSKFYLALGASALLSASFVSAHEGKVHARADSHAPIAVMAEHMHKAGEWMFSYRYMTMAMEGNRDGGKRLTAAETRAAGPFMVAPLKMDMQMHMLGAMYAPSDKLTLMFMLPYTQKRMNHERGNLSQFVTESEGAGDFKVAAMLPLYNYQGGKMHATLGLSLPTGSIDEKAPNGMVMPYPMQLGSGTYDLNPNITWAKLNQGWSWGAQTAATIRMGGANSRGYRLGNALEAQTWAAWNPQAAVSLSARLQWQAWQNIEGADASLNPMMVPTADSNRRAGRRTDLHLGVNWVSASGHRLAFEYGVPVQQHLDGPQLEVDSTATVGYQYAF